MSILIVEDVDKHVKLIKLNRPEALNALNLELRKNLAEVFTEFSNNDDIRAIVITGNEKAFVAGADLKELLEVSGPFDTLLNDIRKYWKPIKECSKPIISAVNGFALGGGCELAMHTDIIVAGENAKFGQPEIKVGIIPGAGGTQRLTRVVGKYKAMRLLLTGDFITGREAYEMGLVSIVVPDDEVLNTALDFAKKISKLPLLSVKFIKELVNTSYNAPLETLLALEEKSFQLLFSTEDQKEGMRAFIEKRKPEYKGR
ncbi:MAG: enoyl-CoA hydratase/isomerase family protein [Methanomethylovorans sp.]|nr:enoyl-CoA hydratase/isomerase family protein [Methanomethylovorans sp.]